MLSEVTGQRFEALLGAARWSGLAFEILARAAGQDVTCNALLGGEPGLTLPFDETEAMSEWIAAECHGPVLTVLEDLLLCCTSVKGFRESRFEVIDMSI